MDCPLYIEDIFIIICQKIINLKLNELIVKNEHNIRNSLLSFLSIIHLRLLSKQHYYWLKNQPWDNIYLWTPQNVLLLSDIQ